MTGKEHGLLTIDTSKDTKAMRLLRPYMRTLREERTKLKYYKKALNYSTKDPNRVNPYFRLYPTAIPLHFQKKYTITLQQLDDIAGKYVRVKTADEVRLLLFKHYGIEAVRLHEPKTVEITRDYTPSKLVYDEVHNTLTYQVESDDDDYDDDYDDDDDDDDYDDDDDNDYSGGYSGPSGFDFPGRSGRGPSCGFDKEILRLTKSHIHGVSLRQYKCGVPSDQAQPYHREAFRARQGDYDEPFFIKEKRMSFRDAFKTYYKYNPEGGEILVFNQTALKQFDTQVYPTDADTDKHPHQVPHSDQPDFKPIPCRCNTEYH